VRDELVNQSLELPSGELCLLQPRESAELPDAGAAVLATDACADALTLVARNARANDVRIETARVDWAEPDPLVRQAPLDLAADVFYERASVVPLLALLPRLAPEAWVADPGRPAAGAFLEEAARRWSVDTRVRGVVRIHRLRLG
jgi:hypothetical protein